MRSENLPGRRVFEFEVENQVVEGLGHGASVALDGVCMTVVRTRENRVIFEAMKETLDRTTLGDLKEGEHVNIERSARVGDEIGGHEVSGHVHGKARIVEVRKPSNNHVVVFSPPEDFLKYIFSKGFIAIDGISLTVVDVDAQDGTFSVHLIPETLRGTTLRGKKAGDSVNIEIEQKTKALVDSGGGAATQAQEGADIAIVVGEFHKDLAELMVKQATTYLKQRGRATHVHWVPGSYEAPLMVDYLMRQGSVAGVCVLGYIEKGHTNHGQVMGEVVHQALIELSLKYKKPLGIGIIGPGATLDQARSRARSYGTKAAAAVMTMLERLTNPK